MDSRDGEILLYMYLYIYIFICVCVRVFVIPIKFLPLHAWQFSSPSFFFGGEFPPKPIKEGFPPLPLLFDVRVVV